MKRVIIFLVIGVFLNACSTNTKIFLVRHAEKGPEADDPHLTDQGKQRAEALSSALRGEKIGSIYTTKRNRTRETAEPLSKRIDVPIQYYNNDTALKFLLKVISEGKNTLIVGHSNTLLPMLKALDLKPSIESIPDNDYDNVFIVKMKRKGPAGYTLKLKETTYGKGSPAPGDTSTVMMK
jgi:2,3-bisphosphoglycerate-dependent phosphoglycerate mutase